MNPIVGSPTFFIGNNGNTLYINITFIGPGYGLSDAVPSFNGVNLNVVTNIINAPNSTISCELGVDISNFGDFYPVAVIINNPVALYNQNIGVAADLPPKTHDDTAANTYSEMGEKILLHIETEALNVLNGMVVNLSNYPETAQHVQNAAKSLKAAMNG